MLYILLVFEIIMTFVNYNISKKDIAAPVVIGMCSLSISTIFTLLGSKTWDLHFSELTFWVFFWCYMSMTLANLLSIKFRISNLHSEDKDFSYTKNIIIIATIISIICTALYGWNAYRVGMLNGGNGLNAFAYMKNEYLADSGGAKMNPIIRQGFKLVMAIAYVDIYVLIQNQFNKLYREKVNKYCIISIVCAVIIVIFSGSRTEIFKLLSAAIFIFSLLWREKINWTGSANKRVTSKLMKKIIPIALSLLVIVFVTRTVVKTKAVELSSTNSFIDYIIFYIGSSIAVLNIKIDGTYINGGLLFGNEAAKSIAANHVYLGQLNYGGNTSTLFGVILAHGLFYTIIHIFVGFFVATCVYKSVFLKSYSNYKRNRYLIVYSMFYYIFTMTFYSDCIYDAYSISNILMIVLVLIYYKGMTKINL